MKKKKRRFNRRLRFPIFLLIIFFLAFFLWDKWDALPHGESKPSAPVKAEEDSGKGITDRLGRLLFLRQAVKDCVPMKNYVTIDRISPDLLHAIVAVEDNRFYSHHGFDLEGIARASLVNLQYGQIEEGASTITQQLVKNLFLSQEQTFGRKAEELMLSMDMEANYSKDEILELYLNTIYFGSNFYGIASAAEGYFGKSPRELDLSEAAMLAGLPNAPSLYSPYVDFILAKKRQFIVLDAMARHGYITEDAAEDAKIRPINLAHE